MSSYNRRFLLFSPLALVACGFQPVYVPGGSGSKLDSRVAVSEPDTRDGFLLVRRVEERLGRASVPAYTLDVTATSRKEGLAVNRQGNITRFNLLGEASFALTEIATGRVISSGQLDNFTGYSATGTTVATLAAERDAQKRLMVILADQIVSRLLATDLA